MIGREGGLPRRLTAEASEERAASWSRDGRWIYFASKRGGDWQVWKMAAEGGSAVQVTARGGFAAFESADGRWLYFTKRDQPGLWQVPARDGEETLLSDRLHPVDWNNWVVSAEGLYFVERPVPDRPQLARLDVRTRQVTPLAPLPGLLYKSGLAYAPDQRAIPFTRIDRHEADLMLVENFR
jgi:hypothetical protein